MQPPATAILDAVTGIRFHHEIPHTCIDGRWYNPRVQGAENCEHHTVLRTIAALTRVLDAATHGAAHDPAAVDAITTAMLAGTPLTDLADDLADGWRYLARLAVEATAAWIDADVTTNAHPEV